MTYYLLFIFILDYGKWCSTESKFDQFSYSSSKWVVKQQGQLTTTMHLAEDLLTNMQCNGGSRSFAKEMGALKMKRVVASHRKWTTTNWEQVSKLILLELQEKLPKNSVSTILLSFGIWSKLERWKSSISGCLTSWQQIKKIIVVKCHLQWTISREDCAVWQKVDFIRQPVTTSSSVWTKKCQSTSQSQTWTQKRSWSLSGGLLLARSTTVFWIQEKPFHLKSMLSKLMRCIHYNLCNRNWSTERTQFFSMMPVCTSHNRCFKSWTNQATKFCLTWPLANRLPLLQASLTTFCRENASTTVGGRKSFSGVH